MDHVQELIKEHYSEVLKRRKPRRVQESELAKTLCAYSDTQSDRLLQNRQLLKELSSPAQWHALPTHSGSSLFTRMGAAAVELPARHEGLLAAPRAQNVPPRRYIPCMFGPCVCVCASKSCQAHVWPSHHIPESAAGCSCIRFSGPTVAHQQVGAQRCGHHAVHAS